MSFVDGSNGNGMYMPVAPAYGGNSGFGNGFAGDGWWVILFLFALMGNGGWGGFGGFGGGGEVLPYLWNQQTQNDVNRGFDNSGVIGQLGNIQNAITNGFANQEVSNCNRAMDSMQTAYQNQIAALQQNFALQTQLSNCCCENRQAIASLGSDLAREACANRQVVADGVQRILTQMCDDKIDAKNEKIADLERQLTAANLAASQVAQTSRILADNAAQTAALEQYLNPTPIPAYVVQNPNCCSNQNYGCGCGVA